jgi:hypothetical protein
LPLADQKSRWVLVAAPHRRDIAEPEGLSVRLHRHGGDRRDPGESAGYPNIDAVGRCVDRTAGDDGVLLGHAVEDLLGRHAEGGELGVAELDENFLRSLADDVDLVDVGDPQQALADVLGASLEFGEAQAIGGKHIERRVDVAVFVVEVRAADTRRKLAPDIAHLLADLVPKLLHLGGRGLVDEGDADE